MKGNVYRARPFAIRESETILARFGEAGKASKVATATRTGKIIADNLSKAGWSWGLHLRRGFQHEPAAWET
jgi:hypothetical protein